MQNSPRIRVLVADDNVINQVLFARMLLVLGVTADIVDNGTQALEACTTQQYDMIFMDYQMPETDGVEAATCIKHTSVEQKPVIVLMTANQLINNYYLMQSSAVDDFLKKPFTLQEMTDVIKKWQTAFTTQLPSSIN